MADYDKLLQVPRANKERLEEIKESLKNYTLIYSLDTNELGVKLSDGTITYFGVVKELEWANILNKPPFATVATSGDYTDLTGKPDLNLKLDKNFSALTAQTNLLLDDVLVLNRGTTVYKVTLGHLLAKVDNEIFEVVNELPTTGVANKIYLVPSSEPETQNELDEFIWVDNDWEKIGAVTVDLSNYFNKTEINSMLDDKVDKVAGKGLSTNDFTNNDKNKLDGIEAGAEVNPYSKTQLDNMFGDKVDKNANITAGTHPKITYDEKGLVTGGEALAASDIPNLNASKINAGTFTAERIPSLEASKISSGTFDEARIPNLSPTKITQDASNRFVTDVEKNSWNAKQSALGFTPENVANKKTTLSDSDVDYPTSKAVKTAIETAVSQTLKPMGNWNANTNTPTLTDSNINRANEMYYVSVAGTQFGIKFDVGDELVYNTNGVIFRRDNVDSVVSVNTKQGVVVLNQDDIGDGATYKRVSQAEKNKWNNKQDKLVVGDNITIDENNVISASGETDPIFTAWDKSTGINITKSQVRDFSHTHNDLYYNKDYIDNLDLSGVEYKGAWVNGSNYKKGDIVYSNENDDTKGFVYLFHTDKNNSTLLPETIDGYCINLNAFTNKAKRIKLPDYSGGATTKGALVATHPSSTYYGDGDQEHRKTFYLDDIYWLKDVNGNFHLYDSRGKLASISELFSGSYNDLTDKPTLFSGNYDDLTNKPTIPTKTSDLTNDSGFATETWVNQKVSSVYKYKGSVATYSNLPTTGLTIGDVYDIQSNGMNYAWTGTSWDALGMTIDLSNYHTKNEIATILLDYLKNKGTVVINPADNVSDPILKLKLLADESSKIEFTNEDNGQIAKQKMISKGNELNIKVPKINTGYTEFDTTVAGFKAITKSNDNTNKRTIFFDNDLWTPDTLLRLGRPLSPFGKAYIEKINNITIPSILDSESDTLAKLSDLASYTKFKGNYTGTTTYKKDEIVKSNNYYYISLQDNNSGNTPNTSPTFWANLNEYADKSALVNILKRTSLVEKRKVLFGNANGYETPLFYDGIYQENGELYDSRGKLASQNDITDVITENITHANLKTKVANSELFPNRKYRIIDYETTGSNVAGHLFDIVLQASSSNTFYEVASAVERSGETYFANRNAKLYEWQIWYDINGNGKGTIIRMIDEHGNDLPFDFKNMLFRRYKATSVDVPNMATELAYLVGTYYATQDETPIFSFDSDDYQDFYTFSHYVNGELVDGSLYSKARNNKITNPETQPNYSVDNIFFGYAGGNTIRNSRYNTFIGVTTANDFSGVGANVFGDGCNYNKIFGNFFENYIGSNFENNIFDNGTHNYNMIKKDFKKNTISGGNSYFNKIDEGFEKNNAVSVWQSTFGKNIKWNNFNNGIKQVILVSGVKHNVFNKSLEYVKIDYTPQTNDEVKNIIVDCELKGVAPNHINLYFTGLENRTYKTTYDLASNGNIVAVHQANNVKRLGKYLNDNTDTTWKDIPDTLGDIESALDAILGV